jgi:transcriptional regulator
VLAIFNGPHTYISSSWYDHENVPTWNYIAVHVYGTAKLLEGEALFNSIKELTAKYEQYSERPVSVETMNREYLEREMRGLVGFEITIDRIEAAYKLSQNRDKKNHDAIISQLEKRNDAQSLGIAEAMKATCPHLKNT